MNILNIKEKIENTIIFSNNKLGKNRHSFLDKKNYRSFKR